MSIARTKGITPVGVEGGQVVEWHVKLSHEPSKGWRDAFKSSEVRAEFADPHDVTFRRNTLLFKCRDTWIAHANRAEVEAEEASSRRAAEHQEEARSRERHLAELRDKYKNV
jgi:hypothetical protein